MVIKKMYKFMALRFIFNLWKESYTFFEKKSIKLFVLASLNTFCRSLFFVARDFWWLLFVIFALRLSGIVVIRDLLVLLLSFFYLLIVRSSVESKGCHYYMRYLKKFPLYSFMTLAIIGLIFIPFKVVVSMLNLPFNYPGSIECGPFSFLFIAGLFLLDQQNILASVFSALFSALRFVFYFFPVMAIIFIFEYFAVYYAIDAPFMYMSMYTGFSIKFMVLRILLFIIRHLLVLLLFSFLVTFYVRVKHKHHKLFFTP